MRGDRNRLETNAERKLKTLLLVYYAGHGCMRENTTQLVLNDTSKTYYRMESVVRAYSETANSYIIVVFDCCREKISPDMRGGAITEPNTMEGDD